MSLEKTWGEINDKGDDELSSLLQTGGLPKRSPKNPLETIKKNLLINIAWAIIICIGYILIIGFFHIWQVQLSLTIVLAFTLWAAYHSWLQYKKINTVAPSTGSLLDELKKNHQSFSNWMKLQQQVALIIYPISAAGGFMLGGVLGSGKPVEVLMTKTAVQVAMPVCIVILTPVAYYLARWMYKYSFGKHLDALQKNINDLEAEK